MTIKSILFMSALCLAPFQGTAQAAHSGSVIGKVTPPQSGDLMTPETLWAMGRVGGMSLSPNGKQAVYTVSYYSVKENASRTVIYTIDIATRQTLALTGESASEYVPKYINEGKQIAFISSESGSSQVWVMNADGSERRQLSDEATDVSDFLFSPNGQKVILIKEVPNYTSIQAMDADLPKSSGMVINDLMYKHWDHYNQSAPHPFVADYDGHAISGSKDLLEGESYECPMKPFGGIEQLAWSPDSKRIAYTCRKKNGKEYAISTDSDIYLYDISSGTTRNLCKPEGYKAPKVKATCSLEKQAVNHTEADNHPGYDQNPQFSPDGRYVAWTSMARDGYESDRTRLCVLDLENGQYSYLTESFESGVNEFLWKQDSRTLYFTGVWHGRTQIYSTNLKGEVQQLTDEVCDYSLAAIHPDGKSLFALRQSMSMANEIYQIALKRGKTSSVALTEENKDFYKSMTFGEVRERWVKTTDNKDMLCWVIYPPHFDPAKKYPTLLFCEGGPQSPVSQFWSFRWNFQIMAAQGYIVIAPNRRGLPGFGMEWLEQISGDYSGQCMQDYLSAIDDISRESYVDKERLGAVGASFGGYSVYWLAGNHNKRFKCFIAHDGIYNTQQQYVETEELWFPNWDLGGAPWEKTADGQMHKAYTTSPHLYVDKWDTPILCIHGQKDFRIEYTQAESAFTAARMRGIEAQMLLFPDENHWVLKPQNGILWQRTFFRWLDKWLKK